MKYAYTKNSLLKLNEVRNMQYRKMGLSDWNVSALGFGSMRLPVKGSWDDIDYAKATQMLRYAIDHGVNYVDTAFIYHEGKSEEFLGKALADGYREKIKLASKSPIWAIHAPSDFHEILDTQLVRLNTDYLDVYLFHGINGDTWNKIKELNLLDEMEKAREMGKIRHIGFSFHGSFNAFKEIIDAYPWDVTQVQYNYMDTGFQATTSRVRLRLCEKYRNCYHGTVTWGKISPRQRRDRPDLAIRSNNEIFARISFEVHLESPRGIRCFKWHGYTGTNQRQCSLCGGFTSKFVRARRPAND